MPENPLMALNELFPEIETFDVGRLPVSYPHELYYEQSGNPDGKPIVFLHGGPGSGTSSQYRRFFDPEFYRIVLFDQRGAGKSTPHADTHENTTPYLVSDMEKLRERLGVNAWMVFGGSWGSTLALSYAASHADKVKGLILRGVFLCREKEIAWYYEEGGAHMVFPEEWERYRAQIPGAQPGGMVEAYHKLLTSENKDVSLDAALAWSRWEAATSKLEDDGSLTSAFADPHFALAFASIENHYFRNKIFLPSDDYLLGEVAKLQGIPARIVQGRYDMVCPIATAWEVKNALHLPDEEFRVVTAGHSALEPAIRSELVQATQDFKKYF
ncbi:MAG: prolyl aminopeptidase [Candidatus Aenigmarchaeota archaeon]|nr:prolyl aminopeptidase [Candidatus Aenigmarchaeota archaeon]